MKTNNRPHRGGSVVYWKFIAATLLAMGLEYLGSLVSGTLIPLADAFGHSPTHIIAAFVMMSHTGEVSTGMRRVVASLIFLGAAAMLAHTVLEAGSAHAVQGWAATLGTVGALGCTIYQIRLLRACGCGKDLLLLHDARADIWLTGGVLLGTVVATLGGTPGFNTGITGAACGIVLMFAVALWFDVHIQIPGSRHDHDDEVP